MIKALMLEKLLGLVIRHGMTVAGGYLVSGGYADENTVQMLTGGAVAAGGVGLSFIEKKFSPRFQ